MATRRQIEANRRNAKKGGPKTPEGKAVSRMNARKHGIFAVVDTLDDLKELRAIEDEFFESIQPRNRLERDLVVRLARTYLRLKRCATAEAESHRRAWRVTDGPDGEARDVDLESLRRTVRIFGRYDRTLTNRFYSILDQLEGLRSGRGEGLPFPVEPGEDRVGGAED